MIKKLTIFIVLSFLLVSIVSSPKQGSGKDMIKEVGNESNKSYNPELYGNFLNNSYRIYRVTSLISKSGNKRSIELSLGEKKTIPVFITRDTSFAPIEKDEEDIQDIYIKFILVNKRDWVPEKAKLQGIETFGKTNKEIGRNHEEKIKFQDRWFRNLRDKTQNIYDLDQNVVHYTDDNTINKTFTHEGTSINLTGLETNISISIKQAGFWSLNALIKPIGGQYWVYDGRKNITLKVEKPPNVIVQSLPIMVPGVIAGSVSLCTYSIKKRKKWF